MGKLPAVNTNATAKDFHDIPLNILDNIHEFLMGVHDDTVLDPRVPHLRSSVAAGYVGIMVAYGVLVLVGVVANGLVAVHVTRHRLYKDPTYAFLVNNVVSDVVKCVCVLPLTLYVLLVQNWMLGEVLCSFLPMLQDIPLHVTTLTFLLMAWDRFRLVRNPSKPRLPSFVCIIGTWLTALCLVLPYPIYIFYVDLGKFIPAYKEVGLCIINLTEDMQEYMRGIFLFLYAGPLATISYLYVKVSRELQANSAVVMFETRHHSQGRDIHRSRTDSHSTTTDIRSSRGECDVISQYSRSGSYRGESGGGRPVPVHTRHELHDHCLGGGGGGSGGSNGNGNGGGELDIPRERRTQKYLVAMVTMYAICLCPLMVLRLARLALIETYDNSGHFDITYTMFVWVGFLPTCSTPLLFAAWQMSRPAKERLRGYFRFSNRKLRQSCETVITTSGASSASRHDGGLGSSGGGGGYGGGYSSGGGRHYKSGTLVLNAEDASYSDNSSYQQEFS